MYKIMNIQLNNNITFTSKNIEIRQADKIMRNLMNEYPVCSTSRVKYYNIVQKDQSLISKTRSMYNKLQTIREKLFEFNESTEIFNQTLKSVKDSKNANCKELSIMARVAFLANGYKDNRLESLRLHYKTENSFLPPIFASERLDHQVLIINAGKNAKLDNPATFSKHAFIVDPWAGICDYVANVFNHYKGTFLVNHPPQDINCPKKFIFEEKDYLNTSHELCQTIAKSHPELVIK